MMSENRFTINLEDECIDDAEERIFISFLDKIDFYELCAFLNEQQATIKRLEEENEQLQTQLLLCQQSKNDDGRFQVWEVPPISMGKRISITTTDKE